MPIDYAGKTPEVVNYLRALFFDNPDWTPCRVGLMPATWMKHREALEDIVLAHPRMFPGYRKGSVNFDFPHFGNPLYESGRHTDAWGTVWENIERGLDSIPVECPLDDWDKFDSYTPPDPHTTDLWCPWDWDAIRSGMEQARAAGHLATGGLPHGFMFMRLYYLRGFENLMMDIAEDHPRLPDLIRMVEEYNTTAILHLLDCGAEFMQFGDDLGMQHALPMSPAKWRKYIKPSYDRMFAPIRERGIPIYQHTDGCIVEIIGDLKDVGVTIVNPQFRANGLGNLRDIARGQIALDQDLDRQMFPFGNAKQIEAHAREVHDALQTPEGGLMLYAECEPDVPLENIDAICTALEKVCNPPER